MAPLDNPMRLFTAAILVLIPGSGPQEERPSDEDRLFWTFVEKLRKVSDGTGKGPSYETLEKFYKAETAEGIRIFWTGLTRRLDELHRWDVWAIGAIVQGHLSTDFMRGFQIWIILQGREFYEAALKDPRTAVSKIELDQPSNSYSATLIQTAALNTYEKKTKRDLLNGGNLWERKEPPGPKPPWKELAKLHPELWEKCFLKRERRPAMPDLKELKDHELNWKAVQPLWDWVDIYSEPAYYLEQLKLLSKAQQSLLAVLWMDVECNNGGMDQFFHNSTGIVAPEALQGLKLFGASEREKNLADLMTAFPGGSPDREKTARRKQMTTRWGEKRSDDEFPLPSEMVPLEARIAAYIRAHPGEFFRSK